MWQDLLIVLAHFGFIVGAFDTIRNHDQKPPLAASILSASGNACVTVALIGFHAWFGAIAAFVLATEWTMIAYQRHRLNRRNKAAGAQGSIPCAP